MLELSDISRKMESLESEVHRRTVFVYIVCAFLLTYFAWFAFTGSMLIRIGACLILASVLYLGYQGYHWRGKPIASAQLSATPLPAYRSELERQREFHRGACFWSRLISMVPGYVLFCVSLAIAHPESKSVMIVVLACFLGLCTYAVPLNLRRSRKYQRQIDELDCAAR